MTTPQSERSSRPGADATIQIPANAEAPSAARIFLRSRLADDLHPGRLRDLELIVTELVTNAVLYGSNSGDEIKLALEQRGRTLYVGVTDRCRNRTSPALLAPSSDRDSGRGLLTVERLADQWADEIVEGERRVWATLSR
jgi:anti-sigma regulatory factor (Ser/Thr protein kinase)